MQRISWWNNTLNYFEDFQQKWKIVIVTQVLVGIFFVYWLIHTGRDRLGNILPNPINIFNHIGNVDSVIPALFVGYLVGFVLSRTVNLGGNKLKSIAVTCGVTFGLLCNILIEMSFGMNLLNQPNVSDPLDVIWGTAFCLVTLCWVFKVKPKGSTA